MVLSKLDPTKNTSISLCEEFLLKLVAEVKELKTEIQQLRREKSEWEKQDADSYAARLIGTAKPTPAQSEIVNIMLTESIDREKRNKNVIVTGVAESTNEDDNKRAAEEDRKSVV